MCVQRKSGVAVSRCGCRSGRRTFFGAGLRTLFGVRLCAIVVLVVSVVESCAFEHESTSGANHSLKCLLTAIGAGRQCRLGDALLNFGFIPTGKATVVINWHSFPSSLRFFRARQTIKAGQKFPSNDHADALLYFMPPMRLRIGLTSKKSTSDANPAVANTDRKSHGSGKVSNRLAICPPAKLPTEAPKNQTPII